MSIVTLTTDLGVRSHYPAVVKGLLLSAAPGLTVADITHDAPNFDLMEAAYLLQNCFRAFPSGSVHLVSVDPGGEGAGPGIAACFEGHYFVGPNNGLLSLVFESGAEETAILTNPALHRADYPASFRAARWFAGAAAFLATGGPLAEVGPPADFRELVWGEPTYIDHCLRGKIIHIDKFGNAITNIRKADFLQLKQDRGFTLFVRNARLRRVVQTYADVGKGEVLAIFGLGGRLEIAIREGQASSLLGLKVHDMVTVEFATPGGKPNG